jgi:Fe-S cluster assembly scaffold protein SufB
MPDFANEFELLAEAYAASGGDVQDLKNDQHGLMLVSGHQLLGKNEIPGLVIAGEQIADGVKAKITVKKNHRLKNPVHLCFGVIPAEGVQRIVADFVIEENASAHFLAHCSFPNAIKVQHIMEGTVTVAKDATMEYSETHYHGTEGGVEVLPKMKIHVAPNGRYTSTFKLIKGTAGKIVLDYEADLQDRAVTEMYAKVYGKRADDISIKESIYLNGVESRGLAKSRIVLSEQAHAEVLGEVIGNGAHSRGHIDCMEIVQGKQAVASALPRLRVVDDTAKLTHEAAIGSVDKKQVETLMARGLTEQEAVDVIVMGLLK